MSYSTNGKPSFSISEISFVIGSLKVTTSGGTGSRIYNWILSRFESRIKEAVQVRIIEAITKHSGTLTLKVNALAEQFLPAITIKSSGAPAPSAS